MKEEICAVRDTVPDVILKVIVEAGHLSEEELRRAVELCVEAAKGDFASSVLTIANAVDPEYLVVEPTGYSGSSAD